MRNYRKEVDSVGQASCVGGQFFWRRLDWARAPMRASSIRKICAARSVRITGSFKPRRKSSYRGGSTGDGPAYEVIQTPAHERYEAPYRPVMAGPIAPVWSGFYFGAHFGAGAGTADFADPFGSSIFGYKVTTPSFLAGAQLGYNWQAPNSHWVMGLEADLDWLDSDGTNTCLAASGLFVSGNCRARPNLMGDLTARVGWPTANSITAFCMPRAAPPPSATRPTLRPMRLKAL